MISAFFYGWTLFCALMTLNDIAHALSFQEIMNGAAATGLALFLARIT